MDVDPPPRHGPVLDEAQLARLAPTRFAEVVQLRETTSTNSVALERATAGAPEGLVVVADFQTAGRGRFDRRWESPPGKSLLFSVLLRPGDHGLPVARRHLALAAVSLALTEGARVVAGVEVQLKWPNDLLFGDRKLAGVLAESAGNGGLVVGAGVNVDWAPETRAPETQAPETQAPETQAPETQAPETQAPETLAATYLSAAAGRPVPRAELLVESLLALDRLYGRWDHVSQLYRQTCVTVGRQVTVLLQAGVPPLVGQAVAIDEQGRLVVRDGAGALVTVAAGDVTHLRSGKAPSLFPQ